ncbi:MAG: nicotinate-nucleotide adenylyltransferase [Actinobacteria bacterium]|nr:nicotinate-nucleotide adenylyltransferase [Actinomycetota bacterium]
MSTSVLRLGVMGGTFDPIHHGHLVAASEVQAVFGLDEVVFVPTGQPWQKVDYLVSPPEDRYLMTVIATASNPRFSVSRIDIDRAGPTYTIDTLHELRAERGEKTELFFITGADALAQIMTWQHVAELMELAHFVGVTRPGHTLADPGFPAGAVTLIEVPAMAISSTDCRARVAAGLPLWYLVPDGVVQYISKRRLYAEQL